MTTSTTATTIGQNDTDDNNNGNTIVATGTAVDVPVSTMTTTTTATTTISSSSPSSTAATTTTTTTTATTTTTIIHEQYVQQQQMIEEMKQNIQQQQVLTSNIRPISILYDQYRGSDDDNNNNNSSSSSNFITNIRYIETILQYKYIRTIRGDGNCYYRAFLYSLLEYIIQYYNNNNNNNESNNNTTTATNVKDTATTTTTTTTAGATTTTSSDEIQRLLQYITKQSYHDIIHIGQYNETAIEMFYDEIVELFTNVIDKKLYCCTTTTSTNDDDDSFHTIMNEENATSDYCTWYLRLITATYIKQDPDRFLPFILSLSNNNNDNEYNITDINQYCIQYIEPMGQECDHIHVLALAEAFQIHVTIVYLDNREIQNDSTTTNTGNPNQQQSLLLQQHEFGPNTSSIQITLLYRPGHYDILYK